MKRLSLLGAALVTASMLGTTPAQDPPASGQRVFEMRTYYAAPGKLDALNKRFRDHTLALFKKHGMTNVGYWVPRDEKDGKGTKLVYLLAHASRQAAEKSWEAFRADPEWVRVKSESEVNGTLVEKVESVFLDPTDYSPIK
jgi:hypothetical protein